MATKKTEGEVDVFDSLESTTRPRDVAWGNWKKFENAGDKVEGYVRDAFFRAEEKTVVNGVEQTLFKAQRGITIEQKDGTLINVGIKRLPFVLSQTDNVRLGDPLRIELSELKPSATKGYSATKIFSFATKALPENAENKTVGELDAYDKSLGGSADPEGEVIANPVDHSDGIAF